MTLSSKTFVPDKVPSIGQMEMFHYLLLYRGKEPIHSETELIIY